MNASWEHVTHDPDQTRRIGRALGAVLKGGEFVALEGPLGAGKTQFVKGLATGLGVPEDEPVVSPTFVLVREYVGRLKLYHFDAYRLSGAAELLALGLEEMAADPQAVLAIEWADRTPAAIPGQACRVELTHAGADERRLRIQWDDAERLAALQQALGVG